MIFEPDPVWKVARYTSAAPLYFEELDNYVDGGVIANNPCDYGMAEIQRYLSEQKRWPLRMMSILLILFNCAFYN